MNEIDYNKQIASLHAEVVALREELAHEKEITQIWLDLANQYNSILEPIVDAVLPIAQQKIHTNNVRKAYEQTPTVTFKADHDND